MPGDGAPANMEPAPSSYCGLLGVRLEGRFGEVVHPMSRSARSWFAILLGMVLGLALLAAAWMFSGFPDAGLLSEQPREGIASHR